MGQYPAVIAFILDGQCEESVKTIAIYMFTKRFPIPPSSDVRVKHISQRLNNVSWEGVVFHK